ncbi:Beta-amylase 2 isoform 1 [Hibiscus syriacus]|uniref:Beta-amylase 2 isoform 1 n=1 Tax=Hibiscus syriacus TaxID=106335 RepID=A0A6A3A9X4_HIBSY|nr:Beta-amylase 2 isoform 1 [Hibiscus syriacus]
MTKLCCRENHLKVVKPCGYEMLSKIIVRLAVRSSYVDLLTIIFDLQTVVCFPYLGGVIELGVTELVPEDPNLLQHVKASLLNFSKLVSSEKSSSAQHNADDDKDPIFAKVNHEIVDLLDLDNIYSPTKEIKFEKFNEFHESINGDFDIGSPDVCSNSGEQNHQMDDSSMLEDAKGVASQVQSWHLMGDDFSIREKAAISFPKWVSLSHSRFKGFHEGDHTILSSLDLKVVNDLHYKRTVSAILRSLNCSIESSSFHTCGYKSSFSSWKKEGMENFHRPRVQHNILKKILFAVPLMHAGNSFKSLKGNGRKDYLRKLKNDANANAIGCVLLEKRRKRNFGSSGQWFLPSVRFVDFHPHYIDEELILKDTIKYFKELEARIEEFESSKNSMDFEPRSRRDSLGVVEQTSDNSENRRADKFRGVAIAQKGRSNKHYKELRLSDDEKPDEKLIINR